MRFFSCIAYIQDMYKVKKITSLLYFYFLTFQKIRESLAYEKYISFLTPTIKKKTRLC